MDAWGTEDEASPEKPIYKWHDEDMDEDGVKESWEDEDEEPPASEPEKASEKSPASTEATEKGKAPEVINEAPLDPVAETLHQLRLVEVVDHCPSPDMVSEKGDKKTLDNFIPKSESEFSEYAELVLHKLRPYEKSCHYLMLLKTVMRLSTTALQAVDAIEMVSCVLAVAKEKIEAQEEANAAKNKTGRKTKKLHMDKPNRDDFAYDADNDD